MWKLFDKLLYDNRGEVKVKDDEPKDDDVDVVLDDDPTDDDTQDPDKEVVVDLDAEDEPADDDQISNKAFAAMRVENKELKKTVEEMNEKIDGLTQTAEPAPVVAPDTTQPAADPSDPKNWTGAQWDKLAKDDWKKAVDLRSKMQAEQTQVNATNTAEFNRVMEESKQSVLTRHPELNDPNSEKSKVYRNIVVANPDYTEQKKGPLTAMYEMEDYMEKNMGYKREDIVKAETAARADESARHSRVQLTSTTGHNITEGNKVTITKDEMDFCKLQGIDPKVYASNKKKLSSSDKGGVQLLIL